MKMARQRLIGGSIGAAGALAIVFGARWSGIGVTEWYIWLLALTFSWFVGALVWDVFTAKLSSTESTPPGMGFGALFAGCCGLLVGGIVAFPMGAVVGSVAGAPGGAVAAFTWRFERTFGRLGTAVVSTCAGMTTAVVLALWWLL